MAGLHEAPDELPHVASWLLNMATCGNVSLATRLVAKVPSSVGILAMSRIAHSTPRVALRNPALTGCDARLSIYPIEAKYTGINWCKN